MRTRREFLQLSALGLAGAALQGCVRSDAPFLGAKADLSGYKALVCVFLFGGNDAYNMLVPSTQAKYDLYKASRLDLAIPQSQLLALNGTAADGASYGAHPRCAELADLFNNGRAALLANVGSLNHPTSKADYNARRVPLGLFSHPDQQEQWQTAKPDAVLPNGWAGRVADALSGVNDGSELPLNLSISGNNLFQRGANSNTFPISPAGTQELTALASDGPDAKLRAAFDALHASGHDDAFEQTYAGTLERGIRLNKLLAAELKSAPALTTVFPRTFLGVQLQMAARLIGLQQNLGVRRQIYFVSLGGFDTHSTQLSVHAQKLTELSAALSAFHAATVEMGKADQVTAFTTSDFGRSLTVNGTGTDHGWSSHQWIVGGAVRGGRIYGQPPSLIAEGDDDSKGGRFIPQTSVDEYAATLLRWFGLPDSDLNYVLPNIGRFNNRNLGFL